MGSDENKIIIVDDEPDICEMLRDCLEMHGFESDCANSGPSAMEMARGHKYNLAVVDYKMPLMNGLDTSRALREINPGIDIIMISGQAPDEALETAIKEGALRAFKKPFSLDELIAVVKRVVGPVR